MRSMLASFLLLLSNTASGFLTPSPSGRYNVTLTNGPLTDYHRDGRTLMLSVLQPATCEATFHASYMPVKTAKFQGPFIQDIFDLSGSLDLTPLFLGARLPVCSNHNDGCSIEENAPVLLFSPAYSIPRLYYSVLASAVASHGFTVITIDHPGDADIITYPDGHAIYNNDTVQTMYDLKQHLPAQIADVSFVIDQLGNATAMANLMSGSGPRKLSTDHVATFGHSLGGATAVLAAAQDSRIRGAINWDGTFVDLPPSTGVHQPVLLMNHGKADPSWPQTWPLLKGPKLWVRIAHTLHQTFTDLPILLQAAGQDDPAFDTLFGTIAPAEMARIITTYATKWMNGVFNGISGSPFLEADQPARFPEVSTVRRAKL